MYLDYEADDGFETAKIIKGELQETEFIPLFDDGFEELKDAFTYCPDCGRPINYANNGGNGFCSICAPDH